MTETRKTSNMIAMEESLKTLNREKKEGVWRVSWDDLPGWCDLLIDQISVDVRKNIVRVLAVSRGGFVPATIIAHKLDIKQVRSLYIHPKDISQGPEKPVVDLSDRYDHGWDDASTLIIDDIVDSSDTAKLVRDAFPHAYFGALVVKNDARLAHYYGVQIISGRWVVFPWEVS